MTEWELGGYTFKGISVAGVQTSLCLPQFKLAFDVALGQDPLPQMRHFFITHGHLDHAAGIPYLVSQKKLMGHPQPNLLVPEALEGPLREILQLWSQIEGYEFSYHLRALSSDDQFAVSNSHFIKSFPTHHRIPSQGYTLFEKKHKLKPEFQNLGPDAIRQLRSQGLEASHEIETPHISFTGDTRIEFVDGPAFVRDSRILFMEVTFLDSKKSVEEARKWGHIHLQELVEVLPRLNNETIVLIHNSARYSPREAHHLVREILPKSEYERVVILPRS